MKKRVLVTGGAGFIGSHLCEYLLSKGHEVFCLDNFFTGSKENIIHLKSEKYFEIIRHDIINPFHIETDEIYNLACPASPQHYQYNPIKTMKTSVIGSINMLGLAKRVNAKILQASTSEVYGDPKMHPQSEEYWGNVNPIGKRSCYDVGKRASETLCMDYHRQNNVHIKIVRIFNTYEPRMMPNDGRVVSNFILQALQDKDITVFGDGKQTRSFQYVDDLIIGLYKMMNTSNSIIGPINIGNTEEFTILELAVKIIELTNSKSKIIHLPLPEDDPLRRKPNIDLAKETLNWKPITKLEEGLIKTINYFDKCIKNNRDYSTLNKFN
ncbi:UDP-glucuronic acid decarboxylase family protein [Tenacibaculum sp. nBUS_03]|uniref:UDP-glucuronic acid decarboxylase family protein n=1 Tax=Tenacibaculum sp. nBUS_03 TaxID=3395320 RepID=UPI003EBD8829